MTEFFEGLVGPGLATPVKWITAVAVIGILLFVFSRLARRFVGGTFVAGGRGRRQRLAVLDATAVDSRRRLVLIRRDDVEHLILIGGPTDVVVEQDIRLPEETAEAQPRPKIVHVPETTAPIVQEERPRERPQPVAVERRPDPESPALRVKPGLDRRTPVASAMAQQRPPADRPTPTSQSGPSGTTPVRPVPLAASRPDPVVAPGRPGVPPRATETSALPVRASEAPVRSNEPPAAPSFSALLDEERVEPAAKVPDQEEPARTSPSAPDVSVDPSPRVAPVAPPPVVVAAAPVVAAAAGAAPLVEAKAAAIPASVTSFVDRVSSARARTEPVLGATPTASAPPSGAAPARPDPVADADIDDALMRELEFSLDDEPSATDRKADGELDADMASLLEDLVGERR